MILCTLFNANPVSAQIVTDSSRNASPAVLLSGDSALNLGPAPVRAVNTIGQDTLLRLDMFAGRIENYTFAYRNSLLTCFRPAAKTRIYAFLSNEHVYYSVLKTLPFTAKDIHFEMNYTAAVYKNLYGGLYANIYDFGATGTRLLTIAPYLQYAFRPAPRQLLSTQVRSGISSDKRVAYTNTGPGGEVRSEYSGINRDSSMNYTAGGFFGQNNILPRRNNNGRVGFTLNKVFNEYAGLSAGSSYTTRRVEDYLRRGDALRGDTATMIQSVVSDTVVTFLNLNYRISKALSLRSYNEYDRQYRGFNFRQYQNISTKINEFYNEQDILLRQEAVLNIKKFQASMRFEYTLADRVNRLGKTPGISQSIADSLYLNMEKTPVIEKDFTNTRYAWAYSVSYAPSRSHVFTANTLAQLLRVSTPSVTKKRDHDEELYSGEVAYNTLWSSIFRTGFKVSGSFTHLVNINANNSSSNSKQRILRFEPNFRFQRGGLLWTGSYNLAVTYSVFDYKSQSLQDRSNRIFLTTQNLEYRFGRKYAVLLDFIRRENRFGLLDWERFRESPLDTVITYDVTLRGRRNIIMTGKGVFRMELGYRLFRTGRHDKGSLTGADTVNYLIYTNNVTLQHGPKFTAAWDMGSKLQFSADCWMMTSRIFTTYRKTNVAYIGNDIPIKSLQTVLNNFYPYFTFKLSYNLYRESRM
ncbi:MAG: hypothetical protein V4543_05505 [Bacteroidota bacterium]